MRTPFSRTHDSARRAPALICRLLCLVGIANGSVAAPAFGQTASQWLFARMLARLAADDSIRQQRAYSYELVLTGTFFTKNDSAQVIEEWRITQKPDSIRAQLLSRRSNGKAEIVKGYESPVEIKSSKRGGSPQEEDPVMAVAWEVLNRIKKDRKAQVLIDGQIVGKSGNVNYLVKFLADDHTGSLWVNTRTADLERLEWAHGKSLGVVSSGQNSVIELAPVSGETRFPRKLIFNERARALLRRTGSYTEIEIRNFQREEMP